MKLQDLVTLGKHEFTIEHIEVLNNITNRIDGEQRLILQVEVRRDLKRGEAMTTKVSRNPDVLDIGWCLG